MQLNEFYLDGRGILKFSEQKKIKRIKLYVFLGELDLSKTESSAILPLTGGILESDALATAGCLKQS